MQTLWLKFSGCIQVSTFKRGNYSRKAKIYATSASCSVAVGGTVALSAVAGGGAEVVVNGIAEVGAKEATAAAEGEIIDIMAGVNFFAFSKKGFNSDWVRP
jgi:hypothetical protein